MKVKVTIHIGYTEKGSKKIHWWVKPTTLPASPTAGMVLLDEPQYCKTGRNFKIKDVSVKGSTVIAYCGVIQDWDIQPSPVEVLEEYGYQRKPHENE